MIDLGNTFTASRPHIHEHERSHGVRIRAIYVSLLRTFVVTIALLSGAQRAILLEAGSGLVKFAATEELLGSQLVDNS